MSVHVNFGNNSRRIAVSSAVPTRWKNVSGDAVTVRLLSDVHVHVRRGRGDMLTEASEHDFLLSAHDPISVTLERGEHVSFRAYIPRAGNKEEGLITFHAAAVDGDHVIIDDGVTEEGFTFGGSFKPGATAVASAAAMYDAILARMAARKLAVQVMRFGPVIQVINENYVDGCLYGAGMPRVTIDNFAAGQVPTDPPYRSGSIWVSQVH